jgi:hypothetical protein
LYRSLRAVKVLLAMLRSTLTVLAPLGSGTYRFTRITSFDIDRRRLGFAGTGAIAVRLNI